MSSVRIGVVVIGRNEGENLRRSLASLPSDPNMVAVYVDSGSSDGSVELARSMGFFVHSLDSARPFSAARARSEGVDFLLTSFRDLEFFQFLDGDCQLLQDWVHAAVEYLIEYPAVAILCGRLFEIEPERSVYNRLSEMQWNLPTGEIHACGGIFMVRRLAYLEVGGFNTNLLTGEEEDLCSRIRTSGHEIVRVESPMAWHDAGLVYFSQWWWRAVWGGYGAALQMHAQSGSSVMKACAIIRKYWIWPVLIPMIAIAGLALSTLSPWFLLFPLTAIFSYSFLFARTMRWRLRLQDNASNAALYAFFSILRKVPVSLGTGRYYLSDRGLGNRPDPHRPPSEIQKLKTHNSFEIGDSR